MGDMATWGNTYWPIFLIISGLWVLLGFGVPEILALMEHVSNHLDNTLSFYARTQLDVSVAASKTIHTIAWWASFLAWLMFIVFVTPHIWFLQFG